ncbi:MAG TPA: ComF family protein [Terriglobales bacterium]|nr:ComF family protein [Terriglobales bacterium]
MDWRVVFSSGDTLKRKRRETPAWKRVAAVVPSRILLRSIFSVLFPSDCRICSTPLDNISRIPVCDECLAAVRPLRAPQCVVCGDRLAAAMLLMGDGRCPNCRDNPPDFERAVSFGEYKEGLRGLIHLLKYESVTPASGPLGEMLAQAITGLLHGYEGPFPVLVPVPLHNNKRNSRGFNQAELIARAAAKRLPGKPAVVCDGLVRHRDTISQVGLSREERIENMRDAFRVKHAGSVNGRSVILVDDVMTTGTTLSECARVLKQAGAEKVCAATVARAFDGADLTAADPGEEEEIEVATTSV